MAFAIALRPSSIFSTGGLCFNKLIVPQSNPAVTIGIMARIIILYLRDRNFNILGFLNKALTLPGLYNHVKSILTALF
jgi:hypothetical protein